MADKGTEDTTDAPTRSRHAAGMENSVLKFSNVNFTIKGKEGDDKKILQDITGAVRWGRVLAIMGPSGAGKTVFISALTLDAFFGTPTGNVTLNGVQLSDKMFQSHCYVVVQEDKHWPYLTCRETLRYAAELYKVAAADAIDDVVDDVVDKMGLRVCADTRNARLSGGQRRRLSIGVALLKSPTILFLDEPTTGLDNASAESVMQEIVRVARAEHLIILCTIHQPSTKVYNGFDQVMVLSKGRVAYNGDVKEAIGYFDSIGYPLPPQMNPAEHFLDLVNADFSDDAKVDSILDTWEEQGAAQSSHHNKDEGQEGVKDLKLRSFAEEMGVIFRRQLTIIVRDPLLYSGRCVVFLIANCIFSLVYLEARKFTQDQVPNRFWLTIWHFAVATQMGSVALYALNDEFKTIKREAKNGMVRPLVYGLVKTVLVIPFIFLFSLFALVLPSYIMLDTPWSSFFKAIILWAANLYVSECLAECLAVWISDPIIGMLMYMNVWFMNFLFGGFLISEDDLFYPFKAFFYINPTTYYLRSAMYNTLEDTTWEACDSSLVGLQPVCIPAPWVACENGQVENCQEGRVSGTEALSAMSRVYGILDPDNLYAQDLAILVALALFYRLMFLLGTIFNGSKAAKITPA